MPVLRVRFAERLGRLLLPRNPPCRVSASRSPKGRGIGLKPRFSVGSSPTGGTILSTLQPADNKFHQGNGDDGKHYWLTPPDVYSNLDAEFGFDFDPCPYPLPEGFDGLTCDWGRSNYANIPFGSIIHEGRKKGPTAWVRKALAEQAKGRGTVLLYPVDKWILMMLAAGAEVRNLGDVRWLATEDGQPGKGTGRHIAAFVLEPVTPEDDLRVLGGTK